MELDLVTNNPRDIFLQYLAQEEKLLDRPPDQLLASNEPLRRGLCATCFLGNARAELDVEHFLRDTVPLLLRQLHRTSHNQRVENMGRIRGRVDWAATYKARYHDEYNPALYVCRQPLRRDDTLENQLLKYLLVAIEKLTLQVPEVLQTAERWTGQGGIPDWLGERLMTVVHLALALQGHIRLREVTMPVAITPRHLLRARTRKTELYSIVARLYDQYEQVVLRHSWEAIRPILKQTLLMPHGKEAEIYLRLTAASFREGN